MRSQVDKLSWNVFAKASFINLPVTFFAAGLACYKNRVALMPAAPASALSF
jgi:hypothetical protein